MTDFERELYAKGKQQLDFLNEQIKKGRTPASAMKDGDDEGGAAIGQ